MTITISVDGQSVQVPAGITLAGALYSLEKRDFRTTPLLHEPRSQFCGMGVCFDCVVKVDGRANVRACQIRVEENMQVVTQQGDPDLEDVG